jgi:Tol biopolymer transport system component
VIATAATDPAPGTTEVVLVDVATRTTTSLTSGRECRHPTFSPDGRWVAAVCAPAFGSLWELILFDVGSSAAPPALLAVDVTP